ncbi:hypothetical protein D9611_007506 [Ephemerocybe angulata]|uniref:Uncharacterized protein n=1 Tax=Ephemerocybe angulata TaxID=980116 RepID=A0A8H5CFB7_9AGAR|nr:hypothetical protein D9611_007506 [Tulosesus angulatus]
MALPTLLSLLFTAQVVSALLSFDFPAGTVRQCEPLSLRLAGIPTADAQRPAALSILPLGFPPVVFPFASRLNVPTDTLLLAALPLPAGTRFLAALEDSQGRPISRVSSMMTIAPSLPDGTNDPACLNPAAPAPLRRFTLLDNPTQCTEFGLQYNSTAVRQVPRVRAYVPGDIILQLNSSVDDPTAGLARYVMTVSRDRNVMLLFDGGNGIRETTSLITVSGDASSPSDCLQPERDAEALITPPASAMPSKTIIIGASAGGGAVLLIGLSMTLFICLDRRKKRLRRDLQALSFDGSRMFKDPSEKLQNSSTLPPNSPAPALNTRRPFPFPFNFTAPTPRTQPQAPSSSTSSSPTHLNARNANSYLDPMYTGTGTTSSWVIPEEREWNAWSHPGHRAAQPSQALSAQSDEARNVPSPAYYRGDRDRLSLNSLDIEGMLNMAAVQQEDGRSRKSSVPMLSGTAQGALGSSQDLMEVMAANPDPRGGSPGEESPIAFLAPPPRALTATTPKRPSLERMVDGDVVASSQVLPRLSPSELSPPRSRRELKVNSDVPDGAISAAGSVYEYDYTSPEGGSLNQSATTPFAVNGSGSRNANEYGGRYTSGALTASVYSTATRSEIPNPFIPVTPVPTTAEARLEARRRFLYQPQPQPLPMARPPPPPSQAGLGQPWSPLTVLRTPLSPAQTLGASSRRSSGSAVWYAR